MASAPPTAVRRQVGPSVDVVVIDDSAVVRAALSRMLGEEKSVTVAETFGGARAAIDWLKSHRVDVILLDLHMPGMDGLAALPELIAAASRTPILIVSSAARAGATMTVRALALGAADTLEKPVDGMGAAFACSLTDKVLRLGRGARSTSGPTEPVVLRPPTDARPNCIAVGASTGGIHALEAFVNALPVRLTVPVLITQHLPPAFVPFFAQQLRQRTERVVSVATPGTKVLPGTILIAPGDAHLSLQRQGGDVVVELLEHAVESRCRPSLDVMIDAAARMWDGNVIATVLTGMGNDGAGAAARLVAAGGCVLAQDARSSTVWGMPGAVARAGLATRLDSPAALARYVGRRVAR